jgi:hypothetical protein
MLAGDDCANVAIRALSPPTLAIYMKNKFFVAKKILMISLMQR